MAKRITWILILIVSALFWSFVISWIVHDRGNAKQVGGTVEWAHGGDTVRLDVSKIK